MLAQMLWLGMCGEFLQLLLGCLYMGVTGATIISMLRKMSACVTQKEKEATGSPPGSPSERKPCPCGLTLSVSFKHFIGCVKHLSL